jgi:hypothetical protein
MMQRTIKPVRRNLEGYVHKTVQYLTFRRPHGPAGYAHGLDHDEAVMIYDAIRDELRAAGIKTPVTWTERKHSKSVWTRLERAYTSRGLKF